MSKKEVRLLALDGGGVRGLSALMILEQLMEAVNLDDPPKPCDYFDMIGGTSTGGLIAVMLGRLKMSIDECIDAYLSIMDRVFKKKQHRVTIKGKLQGRFDSDELARAAKEVITARGLQEDTLLKDAADAPCKVFVCATSKETSETVCLTSYKSPRSGNDLLNSVKIWEACRATSAASSFFDPIAVGRYKEEFLDGGTGANNPIMEVWNQAQLLWGPEPLEGKVRCVVSIGTGVPSLKPFDDDVLHIGGTLVAMATETEQTAERFRRDKAYLDDSNRYFRFNVAHGLEEVALDKSDKKKEVAAATRRYMTSQEVYKQMQTCAGNLAGKEYMGEYRVDFSLQGVLQAREFIDRPSEMRALEQALLPRRGNNRRATFVLYGLGGIGKTQLAVEFMRRYQRAFSCVFWLDGSSQDSLQQGIARNASRIPDGQISQTSKQYAETREGDIQVVAREVLAWLALPDNSRWLVVFDNVDREHGQHVADPLAYDVRLYFPAADHGSVLITSRLARLEQLGTSQHVTKVDEGTAQAILSSWYKKSHGEDHKPLLDLLDGLPLAIAQAGAYLQETGVGFEKYVEFYEQQWAELIGPENQPEMPLQEYGGRSVWTTWALSYDAIWRQSEAIAKLLLLWSCLNNQDMWYGLFNKACGSNAEVAAKVSDWIGSLGSNEMKFVQAMRLLRNYSMIEEVEGTASYTTHPVVHKWANHYGCREHGEQLAELAVLLVGWAVPNKSSRDYMALQKRLLPHALVCTRWTMNVAALCVPRESRVLGAIDLLGRLYADQG
ncbi:FabD/lysophospholipase-like protein, partial [Aaosphaeria arxii CBS 175.79]